MFALENFQKKTYRGNLKILNLVLHKHRDDYTPRDFAYTHWGTDEKFKKDFYICSGHAFLKFI